ncbi:sensor histidine kinase [Afipia sp. TerB]
MGRRFVNGATSRPVLASSLCICVLFLSGLFSGSASSPQIRDTKLVLILHSFGRDFRPWGQYARTIREQLEQLSPWHLDIQDHALISARSTDENPELPFIAYLNALNSQRSPDIVISIGAPAASFVQRNRERVFLQTPLVLTAVEQRRVKYSSLSEIDTVIAVSHDYRLNFETILRVLPSTERIVVVNGASPNEKFWLGEMQKDAQFLQGRVQFVWPDNASFQDFLNRSEAMPPNTAIFWHLMNVDATGIAYEGGTALGKLHDIANAPIFSYDDGFFGQSIVGGPMYSVLEISHLTAAVAIRILGGENPRDIKISPIRYADPKFDWREMQRWGISESDLPPGSQILFREPKVWEKYRWQSALVAGLILVQGALIGRLLHERRGRRLAEVESRKRLAELAHLNRYSAAGELTTSIAHELNQPLGAILTNAETAELMLQGSVPDIKEVKEILADIKRDDQRASEIIHRLRRMLRKAPMEARNVDLNEVVRDAIGYLRNLIRESGVQLKSVFAPGALRVDGDIIQLQQVVLNLTMNAMDAVSAVSAGKREIAVVTSRFGTFAEIRVSDTGAGIAADDLQNVFDPFFSTKPHGMGMGLAIARTIVEAHNGQISAESHAAGGALFTIRLPLSRDAATVA